ncbi:MAG: thymidine kinase, partial [Planctomycetes bacterium]|nr:thymidine kinase [Planctomycetota bacterium]
MSKRHIELIIGCMFSGKTTELIRRIEALAPSTAIVTLKPAIDDRYSSTHIVTHHRQTATAQTVENAPAILDRVGDAEVVAIDEIHFFGDAIVEVCQELAKRGMRVICTGLDLDMWGDVFPHVELSRIAETTVLTAECKACGRPANRTHRTVPLLD